MTQKLYFYEGPVTQFNKVINKKWSRYTKAVSPKRAIANLQFQYKMKHGLVADSKIELPGTLTLVDWKDVINGREKRK